jgi:hypothetical protein
MVHTACMGGMRNTDSIEIKNQNEQTTRHNMAHRGQKY